MESIESRTSARHSTTRTALLLGTALGCVGYAAPAGAQNIVSYGTTDYSLSRSERTDGGPATVSITTTDSNITLDLGERLRSTAARDTEPRSARTILGRARCQSAPLAPS